MRQYAHLYMCDTPHSYVWCVGTYTHVPHTQTPNMRETRLTLLIYTCDMSHPYVWHAPFMCVIWPVHMCNVQPNNPYAGYVCDIAHLNVWHVWHYFLICVTWLIHISHSYVLQLLTRDVYIYICVTYSQTTDMRDTCVPWLIRMCDMPHDSCTCVTCSNHMCGVYMYICI